jgi:ribosomal protein S18 acetylase RimI-like enzyme
VSGRSGLAVPHVRRAGSEDLPTIADTLAAAFVNYPWTRWTVPDSQHDRPRLRKLQQAYLTAFALPHGAIWATADLRSAAAFVRDPTAIPESAHWDRIASLHGADGLARIEQHERAVAQLRPHHDWTLATVGTHPDHQSRGYGAAVITAGLRDIDASGGTCLLETSTDDNIRLYQRLGFQMVTTLSAIAGSPPISIMLRRPSGAAS